MEALTHESKSLLSENTFIMVQKGHRTRNTVLERSVGPVDV